MMRALVVVAALLAMPAQAEETKTYRAVDSVLNGIGYLFDRAKDGGRAVSDRVSRDDEACDFSLQADDMSDACLRELERHVDDVQAEIDRSWAKREGGR